MEPSYGASRHALLRAVDAFVFSSGLAAAIGCAFSLVASRALDAPDAASWALLTAAGSFIVYNLDRLRDVERDRTTSPLRTRFVARHRGLLGAAVACAAIVFAATLWRAPLSVKLLCAVIGSVGLLHRRLKRNAALKTIYVSLAWVAACVGMPWLASGRTSEAVWIAGVLFATLMGNLIASNLRDDEAALFRGRARTALWVARGSALIGIAIALAAPPPLRALVWIPVWEGLALATFRTSERYGHLAIDGALLIGAFAAWGLLGVAPG